MILVYKLPGPKMITSASSIARNAAPSGFGCAGSLYIWRMRLPELGILLSPSTIVPSVISATNLMNSVDDGITRPRTRNNLLAASSASSTSPSYT